MAENLALQNIQARSRMVTAYEFSQLLPTIVCKVLGLPTTLEARFATLNNGR